MSNLGSMSVGSTVKLKVNGTARDFIIVHQGKPSSMYDNSCNGTWLLMKDVYETRQWHSSNTNSYKASTIHEYLNGTFLNLFDSNIKNSIKQVKIPYVNGTGNSAVASGSSGLSAKIFLLSGYEVGWAQSTHSYFPVDGACLKYFEGTSSTDSKRIGYLNGSATGWWLRSPYTNYTGNAWHVYSNGDCYSGSRCTYSCGVRPALVLDSLLSVSSDGSVSTNSAPSTPSSITVPSSIMGGTTITVKWGTSTDSDSNLEGYKVERSTNGGSSWSQIYQGNATSTTNTVAMGTSSVMYRVKAYDSAGAESGYKTSSQITVINNHAPTAPATLSVPTAVKGGGSITITWTASTDEDGNLSGYKLERSVNGGAYSEIYKGTALTYKGSITKGWNTVQYRVKAYDPYAESGYTTSTSRTVDNNTAPTITCSNASGSNLGTKNSGFEVSYSVDDVDSADSVTVKEKLDGTVKRTFTATKKATNKFQVTGEYFMKVLNGSHTLAVEASDGKATTTHSLTFTKSVTSLSVTLSSPIALDAAPEVCAISITGSIPGDAVLTVKVTNNANDASPVWEDATSAVKSGLNHIFENKTASNGFAFNFLVTAERGASGNGGYITSIQGGVQ